MYTKSARVKEVDFGGGIPFSVYYPSWNHQDVPRFEIVVLVGWNEEGCG